MEKMKRLREDDRGLTLFELIVSFTILAVIMIPLMNAFLSALNTSDKASDYGENTSVLENTMELIASAGIYDINDVTTLMNSLTSLAPHDGTGVVVSEFTGSSDNGFSIETTSRGISVNNVNVGSEGAGALDVVITPIDPDETDDTSLAFNGWYGEVERSDFSNFTNVDVTLLQPGSIEGVNDWNSGTTHIDVLSYKKLLERSNGGSHLTELTRNIIMKFTKPDDGTDASRLKYTVYYEYEGEANNGQSVYYDCQVFTGYCAYGGDGIASVQMIYYPLYLSTVGGSVCESFQVENEAKLPINLFLIKQNCLDEYRYLGIGLASDTKTYTYVNVDGISKTVTHDVWSKPSGTGDNTEESYSCSVSVNENRSESVSVLHNWPGDMSTKLFTNMFLNLADDTDISGSFKLTYEGVTVTETSLDGSVRYTNPIDLEDKLVISATGGRGFNVLVRIYAPEGVDATTKSFMDQMTTVILI